LLDELGGYACGYAAGRVSAKMPSVWASSLMESMISGSEMSSDQPPDSRMSFRAKGPSAGLPMASERASCLASVE